MLIFSYLIGELLEKVVKMVYLSGQNYEKFKTNGRDLLINYEKS